MQREVIKWLQSLDLTYQVRHPLHDLSNGFILAEIVSRYDSRVGMHSYVPGCSSECKRRNWKVLLRDLSRIGCSIMTPKMAEAIVQGRPGAAVAVLEDLYEFFNGRSVGKRAGGLTAELVDALEGVHSQKSSETAQEKELPRQLYVTHNDELADSAKIRQPGFARPTASKILHVANRDTRNAPLIAAIPLDELCTHQRNKQLLNEHELLLKAYRYVEPNRYAPASPQRRAPFARGARGARGGRGGGRRIMAKSLVDRRLPGDKIVSVDVNVMGDRLIDALRVRGLSLVVDTDALLDEADFAENTIKTAIREIFVANSHDLRLSLSTMLSNSIEDHNLSNILEQLMQKFGTSGSSTIDKAHREEDEDVFCTFLGHLDAFPFAAAVNLWSDLTIASECIAESILARPLDAVYFVRALHFIFTSDVARVRLLHVSNIVQGKSSQITPRDESQSRRHHSSTFSDALIAASGNVNDSPQQVILSNEWAFHIASAFSLFSCVGEALHYASPTAAMEMLTGYIIPAVSRLLPTATAAFLEAVARVVVAYVCGTGATKRNEEVNVHKDETKLHEHSVEGRTEEKEDLTKDKTAKASWDSAKELTKILEGPLRTLFGESESGCISFNVFLYHVLRQAREVIPSNMTSPLRSEGSNAEGGLVPVKGPIELLAHGLFASIGSPQLHERTVSLARLVEILAWDRWDLVFEPLAFIVRDVKLRGSASGYLLRAADAWECRVLLLELLTIAFRKALYVIAERSFVELDEGKTSSPRDDAIVTLADRIREHLNLADLEEAISACLTTFFNAPLMQRRLALCIVGRRLLPAEQRNVAAVWLRLLFTFSEDHLDFLLRPHEGAPLPMADPTAAVMSHYTRVHESVGRSAACFVEKETDAESEDLLTHRSGMRTVTPSPLGDEDKEEAVGNLSSLHVLLGRVEPAYIVSPMNQSWDTFSVVLATLMFEDLLTTTQVFLIVVAALLSPQRSEAQRLRLMQNLRTVGAVDGATCGEIKTRIQANSSPKEESELLSNGSIGSPQNGSEKSKNNDQASGNDDEDGSLALTLGALVTTYVRGGTQARSNTSTRSEFSEGDEEEEEGEEGEEEEEEETEEEEENAEREKDSIEANEETIAKKSKGGNKIQKGSAASKRGTSGSPELDESEEAMESHVTAFWLSVLRLLRQQVIDALALEDVDVRPQQTTCRIGVNDSPIKLKRLAKAILITLFGRYAEHKETINPEDEFGYALEWLVKM